MNKIITFMVALTMLLNGVIGDADEDWLKFALDSQRSLVASFTIDKAPLVGTHNSYSSGVYSMLFKNQELSITTQLHLGVRFMELDLHYIPELNRTEQGPYRMCHSSSGIYTACKDQAGWNICGTVGIVDYGDDTGCVAANPNFTQIFEEISDWLNTNPENVLVINFDDSISSTDVASASDMAGTVNGWLKKYFGNSIYTPADLSSDGSKWPTVQTLITRGKQIIFNTNDHTFGGIYIHADFRGFVWPKSKIKFFSGYPSCTSNTGSGNGKFAFFQEDLLIQSFYGVLVYNGTSEVGAFTPSTAASVMMCEFSTFYDFFTINSAKSLVWSWDTNQPAGQSCGSFNPSNGRWLAEDCNLARNFACRSNSNSSKWVVGSASSNRYNYSESTICPTGYSFSTPRTAKENYFLRLAVQSSGTVWISMNNYPNGTWSDVPTKNFAVPSSSSSASATTTTGSKTSTTSSTGSLSSTTSATATTGVVTTVDPAQKGTGHKLVGSVFLLAFLMLL